MISSRPSIDLICVIDKSGSMNLDLKMHYVENTLIYLLELLKENDRISIV